MRHAVTLVLLLVALHAGCRKKAAPLPPPVSPALQKVEWLQGAWMAQDVSGTQYWQAVGGALYGIGFSAKDDHFEVLVIDDAAGPGKPDGELRLYAMPSGQAPMEFSAVATEDASVKFANPRNGFPTLISYKLEKDVLTALASNSARVATVLSTRVSAPARAPELEAADRAFSADCAERGYAAWTAAFEPTGGAVRGNDRLEGATMHDRIKPVLDNGVMTWEPTASGVVGNLGYTVGITSFKATTTAGSFRTSYARIWAKQADGRWKVRFDTNRWVNE